jgi:hypothetical protein
LFGVENQKPRGTLGVTLPESVGYDGLDIHTKLAIGYISDSDLYPIWRRYSMLVKKTMNLPKELLEEAVKLSDSPTQTSAVILALQEFVRKKKLEKLLKLRSKNKVTFTKDFVSKSRSR